jgi:hypothetical protein
VSQKEGGVFEKMNKLAGIINSLNYKELKEIQRDLAEGNMGKVIKSRMDEIEKSLGYEERICPTCGNPVAEATAKYILVFGPPDFRKRGLFDEIDCLTFFVDKLKVQKNVLDH